MLKQNKILTNFDFFSLKKFLTFDFGYKNFDFLYNSFDGLYLVTHIS